MAKKVTTEKKVDWTNVDDVFDFIEKLNGRKLAMGEKELIIGQREINRRFFDAINAILDTLSPPQKIARRSTKPGASKKSAQKKTTSKSSLDAIKEAFQDASRVTASRLWQLKKNNTVR